MPNATIVVEADIDEFDGTSNFRCVNEPSMNMFSFNSYESKSEVKVVFESTPETIS